MFYLVLAVFTEKGISVDVTCLMTPASRERPVINILDALY